MTTNIDPKITGGAINTVPVADTTTYRAPKASAEAVARWSFSVEFPRHGGSPEAVEVADPKGAYVLHSDHQAAVEAKVAAERELRAYKDSHAEWVENQAIMREALESRAECTEHKLSQARAELEGVRALLREAHKAMVHYARKQWSPVANYSDGYWYMEGRPWIPADNILHDQRILAALAGERQG